MNIAEIKTPSLLLDVVRVKANAERMSEIARRNNVRLRPHIKTHKCIEVARIQTEGHDGAITVSTLEEARAFAKHGFRDITYAVPIEKGKFADAIEIKRRGVKLNLLTDDAKTVEELNKAAGDGGEKFDVFVKIDCGTHRVGVESDSPQAIEIPRKISDAKNLNFAGILTHAGHSYDVKTKEEILTIARHERESMVELADRLRGNGIEVSCVSIGSTPTMTHVDHLDGVDEIRPGNYIFFDGYQATLGSCTFDDTALTVLAAVIHLDAKRRKLVIDARRGGASPRPLGRCRRNRSFERPGPDASRRCVRVRPRSGPGGSRNGNASDRFVTRAWRNTCRRRRDIFTIQGRRSASNSRQPLVSHRGSALAL